MPSLNWIGKEAVVNHDKEVPFKLLKKVKGISVGENSENLIIHGDNLEALKALMPFYHNKIKCIYIDPPYNTGNENWVYNDKVDSPKIRRWLGKVVGRESEDLTRHDKWLCMMYPRLKLLRDLLADEGAIFISIDDNEQPHLRVIFDDIFGIEHFVAQVEWQKRYTRSNNTDNFTTVTEHIVIYRKSEGFKPRLMAREEEANARYLNPDNDPRGPWKLIPFRNPLSPKERPNLVYEITNPNTGEKIIPVEKAWRVEKSVYERYLVENRMWWGKDGKSKNPGVKRFLSEVRSGMTPINFWDYEFAGHTDIANAEIKDLFGEKLFETPKPTQLIKRILQLSTDENDLILDS